MSRNRVDRLYKEDKLVVHRRRRDTEHLTSPNQAWMIDFQQNKLASGEKAWTLYIGDVYTGEMLKIEVDTSLTELRVVRVLERLRLEHGPPERIMIGWGLIFTSKLLRRWSSENNVTLQIATPDRPMARSFAEIFHDRSESNVAPALVSHSK